MERRKDYRHALSFTVSFKCPKSRRFYDDVSTDDVSASGMKFTSGLSHDLGVGDKLEIQLLARVPGQAADDTLIMATRGTVIWVRDRHGAIHFDAPLIY